MNLVGVATLIGAYAMLCAPVFAQTAPPARTVDEQLAIGSKTIIQAGFRSSLDVELAPPLALKAGVSLSAGRINLSLRGITGHLQFRGDLSSIQRIIQVHRTFMPPPVR